jgi:hypothetical protein
MAKKRSLTRIELTKDKKLRLITLLSLEEIKAIKQAQVDFKLSLHEVVHLALEFGLKELEKEASRKALIEYLQKEKEVESYLEKVRVQAN